MGMRSPGSDDELGGLIGTMLGQYRVVERIGQGGMATVFKAYQTSLERYVAIKVLPAYHAQDPVFVKRFSQEARSVAKLAHPNIVQIHDFGEHKNITYIVMEYVDGGTLKDRLKGGTLSVPEAVDFMIQAAEGLSCAHRYGIVHRDVKPANMLVRQDGSHLLLADFGIAKILEGTTNLTRVGTGIGTPQYMSPEQGMGQAVDRRSDLYSLGIVLFHCLTGRVPFTADSPLTITVKHVQDPLPVERLVEANIPNPVIQVIAKVTSKRGQERYQSAEELIVALTNAVAASNLSMPRWPRGVVPQTPSQDGSGVASGQLMNAQPPYPQPPVPSQPLQPFPPQGNNSQPLYPSQPYGPQGVESQSLQQQQQQVTLPCFRCGALNASTRLFCTTCGDDLANKRAILDRYLGSNGRPVLARLSIQNGQMAGRAYRFHQDVTTIGRTNGNDLVISERTVSRRHARLFFRDGTWYLEDLGSANGTFVNSGRIQNQQSMPLKDGDVINFGDEVVVFNITY